MEAAWLKRVLHIGPIESRGGMQATIRHHLAHPPPGWKTEAVNTHVDGSPLAKIGAWRSAKRELKARLKTSPPDIVHIHTATRFSWWRKLRATRLCLSHNVPVVLQVHAGNFHFFMLNRPPAAKEFIRLANHPKVTTVALTRRHKREIGIDDMAVIGSPAPPVKQINPSTRDPKLFILLARPSPIKGHRLAISAVQELRAQGRDVHLHLSGLSPTHPWVSSLSPEQGIHARGWLSGDEKQELIEKAGILLIPSNYEGMPVAAMEALSCGLPVVASKSCEGILREGGMIVESLDVNDWVKSLATLLDDEERWRKMSLAGSDVVKQQTPEVIGKKWAALYDKALGGREK